jgi:transcriptional regulator with XRE-family HTH domain
MSDRTYASALGTQLRDRRKLLRLNQTEVAELAGTTQRTVSLAESGKAAGIELYLAVADVLGLEVSLQPHDEQAMRRDSAGESPR